MGTQAIALPEMESSYSINHITHRARIMVTLLCHRAKQHERCVPLSDARMLLGGLHSGYTRACDGSIYRVELR
jgi:hypothetical protein